MKYIKNDMYEMLRIYFNIIEAQQNTKKKTHLKFVYLVVETKYRNHYEFTCKFEMFIALEKYPPNPREMIVKLVRVEK